MKQVNFRTNILLKNIIGKDLITDDNIAVLELVKNSYDAGSTNVELVYDNILIDDDLNHSDRKSTLLVCDNGVGMDEDGIINKWLNIAYSEKKDQSWMNGRRMAGNKGVGRFSCDRLGKQLVVYTKKEGNSCLSLSIDWTLFEIEDDQDKQIQELSFALEEVSDNKVLELTGWHEFEHGTILQITDLRERWSDSKILRLRRDLEKFINPNQSFQTNGFRINIKANEYLQRDSNVQSDVERVNGFVENKVFDKLNFKTTSIFSYIDETGDYLITALMDRGRNVFELKEPNPYPHLRNVKTSVFYLNTYTKRYFNEQTGFRSLDFGSIFLFVNGFRVPPYGDQGDDWLGIERRKAMGFRRYLSTREVVGRIEVNDESSAFKIITSRSGIVRNDAFDELSREGTPYGFFYKAFRRLERFVVEGICWDRVGDNFSKETTENENFRLDDFTRNKQILSVVRKIIDIPDEDIIELNVNESLIRDILDKQLSDTQQSISTMLDGLSTLTANLDVEGLKQYRKKLNDDSQELTKLVQIINQLSPTAEQMSEISAIQSLISEKESEINQKTQEVIEAKAAREAAEAEAERLRRELEIEKEKNTYLLSSERTMSEDAKGMVHNIKLIALALQANINVLYRELTDKNITDDAVLKILGRMRFNNEKALKISKLITRANFRTDKEAKMIDVIKYISQYLSIYGDAFEKSCPLFRVIDKNTTPFRRKLSTLDLAIVFDNLISNATKAHAKELIVTAMASEDGKLLLLVQDDGEGLNERFIDMPDRIFELGVTTTDGSGIGLYTVREVLSTMGAKIVYSGKGCNNRGTSFTITI